MGFPRLGLPSSGGSIRLYLFICLSLSLYLNKSRVFFIKFYYFHNLVHSSRATQVSLSPPPSSSSHSSSSYLCCSWLCFSPGLSCYCYSCCCSCSCCFCCCCCCAIACRVGYADKRQFMWFIFMFMSIFMFIYAHAYLPRDLKEENHLGV